MNFKDVVWPLPASELLYVGRATNRKLSRWGIDTIGDIANIDRAYLKKKLGKWGEVLWYFANGTDHSPVVQMGEESTIKSVGNSITTPRDLENDEDVQIIIYALSESVAARMREHGFKCRTVHIHIRDNNLYTFGVQGKLPESSNLSSDIAEKAMDLFKGNYSWENPIRSVGVRGCDLVAADNGEQLILFIDQDRKRKLEQVEAVVDNLRHRFGNLSVQRAILLKISIWVQSTQRMTMSFIRFHFSKRGKIL